MKYRKTIILCLLISSIFSTSYSTSLPFDSQESVSKELLDITYPMSYEKWYQNSLFYHTLFDKVFCLDRSLSQKNVKKWEFYPKVLFLKAHLLHRLGHNQAALKIYLYLAKKYPQYLEPYIEVALLKFNQDKKKKTQRLLKKGIRKIKYKLNVSDLKLKNLNNPIKENDLLLLHEIKLTYDLHVGKKRYYLKTYKTLKKHLEDNSSKDPSLLFTLAYYHHSKNNFEESTALLHQFLSNNWENDLKFMPIFILNNFPSFQNFYLQNKEQYSETHWGRKWTVSRKDWQIQKWETIFSTIHSSPYFSDSDTYKQAYLEKEKEEA